MPRQTVVKGLSLLKSKPYDSTLETVVSISNTKYNFQWTAEMASRSLLVIGAPGFGKTVGLLQIAKQLRAQATAKDVFVFFDTKGDYYKKLRKSSDAVIGYGRTATAYWNIFAEMAADGRNEESIYDNAYELSTMLFSDKIDHSSQPFFPNAGRDITMGLLYSFLRQGLEDSTFYRQSCNNKALAKFFREKFTVQNIIRELRQYDETSGLISNISGNERGDSAMNPQSQGVVSEAAAVGREIFNGGFAREGDFSVRNFIRGKGAKALFIEYDMARSNTLLPIYRALCDIVLKEALSRECNSDGGRVYVFMDELRLLPNLQYLENAINFGRGMGLTIIAGLQSTSQVTQTYGEEAMRSIIDSFGTVMMFNTSNAETRKQLVGRVGKNMRLESSTSLHGYNEEQERISDTIEDWDITGLDKGYCIVHTIGDNPYIFKFPEQ